MFTMVRTYKNKNKKLSHEDIIEAKYHMRNNNISTYTKRSLVRGVCGVVCIVAGVSTFLVPCTTIPLCILGAGLLGYDMKALIIKVSYEVHRWRVQRGLIFIW